MNGVLRKVEYEGDFETFFAIAQKTLQRGGSLLYNVCDRRGVIVEPDLTEKLAVRIPELTLTD